MKKRLFYLLFCVSAFFVLFSVQSYAYILGDADNNFEITAADARYTLRLSVGLEKCDKTGDTYYACDVDKDGLVKAADARLILRASVGLEKFTSSVGVYDSLTITSMPYKTNGLLVEYVSVNDGYLNVKITNNNKNTISDLTCIPIREYNAADSVIYERNIVTQALNNSEFCNCKLYIKEGTKKIIFGSAVIKFTDYIVRNETMDYNGIKITKAPFTLNGITIESYQSDSSFIYAIIRNDTGKAIKNGFFDYTKYGADDLVLGTNCVSFDLDKGEKCKVKFTVAENVKKILFNKVTYKDDTSFSTLNANTMSAANFVMTALPATSQGISFSYVSETNEKYSSYYKLKVKVTNNTSARISTSSKIYYKCYDKDGFNVASSYECLKDLSPNESTYLTFSFPKTTAKILLGNLTLDKKTVSLTLPASTAVVNGITIDKFPFTSNGINFSDLTIASSSSSYNKATFCLTNKTGKSIEGFRFYVKTYDSNGMVVDSYYISSSLKLNNGEFTYKTLDISKDITKVLIYSVEDIYTDKYPVTGTTEYITKSGIQVNKTPFTSNGYKVNSINVETQKYSSTTYYTLKINITNNTGKSNSGATLYYKIYGSKGEVISTSGKSVYSTKAGESAEIELSLPDGAAKVFFYKIS